ncbi:hypothetical protein IQ22_01379 [Pseudomonas duriflava]|uniref:Lipoprotein n=1 Tax=Pseudomonas duriflava TaxID=459528 RepID=A0A562QFC1_9PSED|nr:DUF6491 family protein [Pseudomonas duriflava]TWI55457.1 hypothetical protein IQ22_01379 [Pseudomonas duriflava]
MHTLRTVFLLGLTMLLAACATPFGPPTSLEGKLRRLGYTQGEPVRTIMGFDLSGWSYLDHRHIALGTGLGRAYLLEFIQPCTNLNSDNRIGYTSRGAGLSRGDVIVSNNLAGAQERCPIGELYKLIPLDR